MAPGLRDADRDRRRGLLDLAGSLVLLIDGEVQQQLLVDHLLPGAPIGQGLEQVLQVVLVRCQEDQGVGVLPGAVALALQAATAPLQPRAGLALAALVAVLRREQHQPG